MLIEIFTAYIIFFNAFCVPVKDKFMLQLSLNNDLKIQQKYLVLIIKWAHLPLAEKNLCFGLEMIDHRASLGVQLVKNLSVMQGTWVRSLVEKILWRRKRLPTMGFWTRKFHGLYSPWGCKELYTTEPLSIS